MRIQGFMIDASVENSNYRHGIMILMGSFVSFGQIIFTMCFSLIAVFTENALCYTTVSLSTAAVHDVERDFIRDATTQYLVDLYVNPLFSGTYQIKLKDHNPNYNPPPSNKDLVNALVTVDSYTYVAGWANGESYQRYKNYLMASDFYVNCSSSTYWYYQFVSSQSFSQETCKDVMLKFIIENYELKSSTPTVIPGEWQ